MSSNMCVNLRVDIFLKKFHKYKLVWNIYSLENKFMNNILNNNQKQQIIPLRFTVVMIHKAWQVLK